MTTNHVEASDLTVALADLAVAAPPGLAGRVLAEVGLADHYAEIDSPIGPLFVAWNGRGVSSVVSAAGGASTFEADHRARTGRPATATTSLPPRLARAIARRLGGDRRARVPLDLRGHTDFEQDVWRAALQIPRGEVRPYGWVAAEIGRPKAVRAVGTALGHNPVPLIVPCHRVVRTDGMLGQYSLGGAENKRRILAAEGADPDALEGAARRGERLSGSRTTRIFCWPSCRHARRVLPQYQVRFRSFRDAEAAGYRPCRVCRPVSVAA